jgi:hypothetical protein
VTGDRSICAIDQPEKAAPTGLVPGVGICLGGGHSDSAGLGSFADLLEDRDAIEDLAVETGEIVRGRGGGLDRDRRLGW